MTTIHDSVHSEIHISTKIQKIIDHKYFERCNFIAQTGNAFRVFPSATHSRKIHQIGCYHLTLKLLKHLKTFRKIDDKTIELISVGALCHDIGHLAGSHNFDYKIIPKLVEDGIIEENDDWSTHEGRSIVILKQIIKELNFDYDKNEIEFIANVIDPSEFHKNDWRFQIVSNKVNGIDTDKMDYILRDTKMVGLKSEFDVDKIIYHTRIVNNQISFNVEIEDTIRELLFARYRIHKSLTHENILKFDLSQKDILINGPVYSLVKRIFETRDVDSMCMLTDNFVLQNGNRELIRHYFDRNTYSFLKSYRSSKKIEIVPKSEEVVVYLKIHICTNNNLLEKVKFHDKHKMINVKNSFSVFDKIPNDEYITYVFKKPR